MLSKEILCYSHQSLVRKKLFEEDNKDHWYPVSISDEVTIFLSMHSVVMISRFPLAVKTK